MTLFENALWLVPVAIILMYQCTRAMRDILVEPRYGVVDDQRNTRVTRSSAKKQASHSKKVSRPHSKAKSQSRAKTSPTTEYPALVTPTRPPPPATSVGSPIDVIPESPTLLTPSVYDEEMEKIQGEGHNTFESYKIPIFQYMKFADVLSMFGDKFWDAHRPTVPKEGDRQYIPMKRVYFVERNTDALDEEKQTSQPLTTHATASSGGGFLSYHFKTGGGHYLFYTFERSSDKPLTVTVYDPNGRASIIENEIQVRLKFKYTTKEYEEADLDNANAVFATAKQELAIAEKELNDIETSIVKPKPNVARDLEGDGSPTGPPEIPVTPASNTKRRKLWTPYKEITEKEMETNKRLNEKKESLLRDLPRLRAARTRASNAVDRYMSEKEIHSDATYDTLCSFTERLVRRIMNDVGAMTIEEREGGTTRNITIKVATDRVIREITYDMDMNMASVTIRCQPESIPENYRGYKDSWMHYVVHNLSQHITREYVERIVEEQFTDDKKNGASAHLLSPPVTTLDLCVTRNFNHSTSLACDYFFQDCEVTFQSVPNLNMSVRETVTSGASRLLQFWFAKSGAYDSNLYIDGMCACLACLYFMNWVILKDVDASRIVREHHLLYLSKHHGEILVLLTAIRKIVESLQTIDKDHKLRQLMINHYTQGRVRMEIAQGMMFYNESINLGSYDTYKCTFTLQSTEASHKLSMVGGDLVFNATALTNRRSSVGFVNKSPHVQLVMC